MMAPTMYLIVYTRAKRPRRALSSKRSAPSLEGARAGALADLGKEYPNGHGGTTATIRSVTPLLCKCGQEYAFDECGAFCEYCDESPSETDGLGIVARCEGELDEHGRPACEGEPVRTVTFNPPPGSFVSGPMGTVWCDECRARAVAQGYEILSVSVPIPARPRDYPCKNIGCPRRVDTQGEFCGTTCLMEHLGESRHTVPSRGFRGRR